MESSRTSSLMDDRMIKLLNFLLQKHQIPEYEEFNLEKLINSISPEEYANLFKQHPEFEQFWQNVDMASVLTEFLVDNGLAKQSGNNLQLTLDRGRDLKKQGSYARLLEDERHIVSEARRVTELELEADRVAHRHIYCRVVLCFRDTRWLFRLLPLPPLKKVRTSRSALLYSYRQNKAYD